MAELVVFEDEIKNKIFTIRGVQVMLDSDLAKLYGVKPIRLREQVKRNLRKFPLDFMFRLNEEEIDFVVSHFAIPSKKNFGGSNPLVFTEQGVANVASILNTEKAIEINIQIMRAFVSMRRFLSANGQIFNRLELLEKKQIGFEIKTDEKFDKIFNLLESKEPKLEKGIFFDGQFFDAHKFISDIIRTAKNSIILIDNFIDERTLNLFVKRETGVKVIIYTKHITPELQMDLNKFNSQYEPIQLKLFENSHDRFLIIDEKNIYHIGASLKDIGKKWFGFSKFDKEIVGVLEKLPF